MINYGDLAHPDRAYIKKLLVDELNKEDWRPSYLRAILKGHSDLGTIKIPTDRETLEIMFFAARLYNTSIKGMLAKNKVRRNVLARQLVCYHLRRLEVKCKKIAECVGIHHTTVVFSHKKIAEELKINYLPTVKKVNKFNKLIDYENK